MSVLYNLTALEALNHFLGGVECGMPESLLEKTEKEIDVKIHPTVRKFVEKYFFMLPDTGKSRVGDFHVVHVGDVMRMDDYLVISTDGNAQYGVLSPDSRENPPVYVGLREGDCVKWSVTQLYLQDYLAKVIADGLSPYCEAAFTDTPDGIEQVAKIFGADLGELEFDGEWGFSLCYNEERRELAVFFQGNGELKNVGIYGRTAAGNECLPFFGLTNAELKDFFEAEFYINSINCNFEYALMINSERIKRAEQDGEYATQVAELKRLSARCLWALGRFDEAEKLLNSAAAAFTDSLVHTYTALSNLFSERGNTEKSEKAFSAVAMLSELSGDYDSLGMLYQNRAQKLDKDFATIDKAIELYDKAIEQYQKMPRPNKHDIARAQQLRGEARRRKKEMQKQIESGSDTE